MPTKRRGLLLKWGKLRKPVTIFAANRKFLKTKICLLPHTNMEITPLLKIIATYSSQIKKMK